MGPEPLEAGQVRPVSVFMSYRRADDRHFIGRLHDRLCDAFGEEKVFRDIDSIPAGTNFRQVILRTLDDVDAVVAVIGPNWARPSGGEGAASTDYMFMELIEALKQGKPIVPVMIEDTLIPPLDGLPADLRGLAEINAISVHADPAFRRDSERLIEAIHAVVAEDRARVTREREEAEERTRRLEAERTQREQRAEQLRAEERAARARLAELEAAAARRQIEFERERLEAIEEELRNAAITNEARPEAIASPPPPPEPPKVTPAAVLQFEPPRVTPTETSRVSEPPTAPSGRAEIPVFELLILGGLVLGIVGLFLNRTVQISDNVYQFNEMSGSTQNDVLVMLLTLATAVPLFLGTNPVEQRYVLAGVVVATFIFGFVNSAAGPWFGIDGYSEGSWYLLKIVQIACLVGAYRVLRKRSAPSPALSARYRIPVIVVTILCSALLVAASRELWSDADTLIDDGYVPDKSPYPVWLVLMALLPIAVTVFLAFRRSYAAQVCLGTIATLGAVYFFAQVGSGSNDYTHNESTWEWLGVANLVLAAVAWFAVVARRRTPSERAATT